MTGRGVAVSAVRATVAAAVVVGVSVATVAVVGAHGGDAAQLHGCVNSGDRSIRLIGAADACTGQESALDWLQAGVPGPSGQDGAPGEPGPVGSPGPQGAPGAAGRGLGFAVVTNRHSLKPPPKTIGRTTYYEAWQDAEVRCPEGETAVGGGFAVETRSDDGTRGAAPNYQVYANEALPNMRGWRARLWVIGDRTYILTVNATCVRTADPPNFVPASIVLSKKDVCVLLCVPPAIDPRALAQAGVAITVDVPTSGATVTTAITCTPCTKRPRMVRAAAARRTVVIGRTVKRRARKGVVAIAVRPSRAGRRVLRRERPRRLRVIAKVKSRGGAVRQQARPVRIRRR